MRYIRITLHVLIVVLIVTSACNKPSLIGSDILPSEDNVNVQFTDTLTISASTIRGEVQKVYDATPSLQPTRYMVGRVEDPVFGRYESTTFSQLELLVTGPNFTNSEIDSIVLTLAYDTEGHYGNLDAPFELNVFEVIEPMEADTFRDYFSNQSFEVEHTPIGTKVFRPNITDSVTVDGQLYAPHLRIPLDPALGERFLDSTRYGDAYQDDFNFTQFFNGIELKGFLSNEAILAFDFNSNLSVLTMYYTKDDTSKLSYQYVIKANSIKAMKFDHDFEQGVVSEVIDQPNKGDSLVYLQSMEGLDVKLEFPNIADLGNIIVNKAELVVTVADETDLTLYPLPSQLILTEIGSDGESQVLITDVVVSASRSDGIETLFGGDLQENNGVKEYRMNLTGHFQDIADGILDNNAIYLSSFPKASLPNRVILGGSNNSTKGIKFNLTYTKLD